MGRIDRLACAAVLGLTIGAAAVIGAPLADEGRQPVIAWGEPKNGVRIGLASSAPGVAAGAADVRVTLWYENTSAEERKVLTYQGGNRCPVMFSVAEGEKQQRFIEFSTRPTDRTPLRHVTLKPGARFHEEIALPFEESTTSGFGPCPARRPNWKYP